MRVAGSLNESFGFVSQMNAYHAQVWCVEAALVSAYLANVAIQCIQKFLGKVELQS